MRMKKRKLLTTLVVLLSISTYSAIPDDGDNFYVFTNGNKSKTVYSLDKIDKIIFDQLTMRVWVDNVKTTYDYSSISLLTFKENVMETVRVETVKSPFRDVSIHYDRAAGVVDVKSEKQLSGVIIYDVLGKIVVKNLFKGKEYRCSLGDAPSGVYLVRMMGNEADTTVKILK